MRIRIFLYNTPDSYRNPCRYGPPDNSWGCINQRAIPIWDTEYFISSPHGKHWKLQRKQFKSSNNIAVDADLGVPIHQERRAQQNSCRIVNFKAVSITVLRLLHLLTIHSRNYSQSCKMEGLLELNISVFVKIRPFILYLVMTMLK